MNSTLTVEQLNDARTQLQNDLNDRIQQFINEVGDCRVVVTTEDSVLTWGAYWGPDENGEPKYVMTAPTRVRVRIEL